MHNLELQFRGNRFWEIIWKFPCPQKILMVTDSSLDFGAGGFGLSEFVSIITNAGHTVATAHRNGSGLNLTIPGNFNLTTAATAVTTAHYDQIWLFGFSTTTLSAPEQATIAQFMQSGGGVFATGDHETIGAGMGANIPRVRTMRNWSTIPMVNPNRHDTVLDPGANNVKQFQDQAYAIPQRIYPMSFSNGGPDNVGSSWSVHPVLRHLSGAVDYLPDHPHESECLAPTPAPEYRKIQRYFLNTVRWLAPRGRRLCWPFLQVALVRFDFEIAELRLPEPHPCP